MLYPRDGHCAHIAGDTTTINIAIPWDAGDVFCFQVTLLTRDGEECCTEKICVRLPDCGCAQLVDHKIECEVQADGTIKYTIVMDVKNLTAAGGSPYPFGYATILPPAGFSPSLLSPSSGPIAPGATGTFKTCYYGAPGKRCFDLALHDPNFTFPTDHFKPTFSSSTEYFWGYHIGVGGGAVGRCWGI